MSRWNDLDSGARDDVKEMLRDGVPVTNTDQTSITEWGEVADYIVYERDGQTRARDANGTEQFAGTDPGAIVKSAYDDLGRGHVFMAPGRYTGWDTTVAVDDETKTVSGVSRSTEIVIGPNLGATNPVFDVGTGTVGDGYHVGNFQVFPGGNTALAAVRVTGSRDGYFPNIQVGSYGNLTHGVVLTDSGERCYRNRFPGIKVLDPAQSAVKFDPATSGRVNRNIIGPGSFNGAGTTTTLLDVPANADTNVFRAIDIENGGDSGAGNAAITDAARATKWAFGSNEGGNGFTVTGDKTQLIGWDHISGIDLSGATNFSGFTPQKGLLDADGTVSTS